MAVDQGAYWNRYIANAQVDVAVAQYSKVSRDWRDDHDIPAFNRMYYIMEGEGYVRLAGVTHYPQPGDLYILPAGVPQGYGTLSDNTYGKYWCHFSAKVIGDVNLFDVVKAPLFVRPNGGDGSDGVRREFERLIRHFQRDRFTSGFHIRSAMLELLAVFFEHAGEVRLQAKTSSAFGKMNAVLDHIEANLDAHMTVEELARLAHFQPNYFIQVFKSFTGFSPIQYINRVRLEKAGHLLAFTDDSVSSIAETVGMEFSYFSRVFKEHTGYTPSVYREIVMARPGRGEK